VRLVPQLGVTWAYSVALSADGRVALTGNDDQYARLWDVATGRQLRAFRARDKGYSVEGGENDILSVAISPDGRHALTGGSFESQLWDMTTGEQLRVLKGTASSVVFSPNGRYVLTGSGANTARLWDVVTGKLLRSFGRPTAGVYSVAFSMDGRRILTGSTDKIARLWSATSGQLIRSFKGHADAVVSVAFSNDGRYIVTGSFDKTACVWDTSTGQKLRSFVGHTERVTFVAFSPDGRSVLTGSEDGTALLWDAVTGQQLRYIGGNKSSFISVAFSADGRLILTGAFDKTVRLWDATTGQQIRTFDGHTRRVRSVAFSQNGRSMLLLSGGDDATAGLWDTATGQQTRVFRQEGSGILSAAFFPDGQSVLTGSLDNKAQLWDAETGQPLRTFEGHTGPVFSVAVSPDGSCVLTGSGDKTAKLWDAKTGELILSYVGHKDIVISVSFSPDGRRVLTGSRDGTALLWDTVTGLELRSFVWDKGVFYSVALSADGRYVLAGSQDGTARIWDASTGKPLGSSLGYAGPVNSVASSPDGRNVLTGIGDSTAQLRDAATGQPLRSFVGHTDEVSSAAFSPDSRFVLTGSFDTTTRLWNAATGKELASLISFENGGWAVVDPQGRFDTNDLDGGAPLVWVVSSEPMRALPLEIFMHDYYTPRLLASILNCETLTPIRSIAEITNRVQPVVEIASITPSANHHDHADVIVEAASFTDAKRKSSGLRDLRLFRNGQMVGYLEGVLKDGDFTFSNIQLPTSAKTAQFTAYAFNSERIKSVTARRDYTFDPGVPAKPHAWLVQIGVNHYQASGCELQFSANDAVEMSKVLGDRLAARGLDVQAVQLVSTVTRPGATKNEIRKALASIAAAATPDDVFFLSFSGHGYSSPDGQFYILPSDIQGSCSHADAALLRNAISSDELADWLRPIDAGEMTFVLDSCYSAKSVESNDFKPGPMGSRGLGQLAYDKRMRILAASRSDETAGEYASLGSGLLSYVLTHEGLVEKKADWKPIDQKITVGEWLSYAADAVPKFDPRGTTKTDTKGTILEGTPATQPSSAQIPAVFDFSKSDNFVLQ
jgi:WD40 repeat protein